MFELFCQAALTLVQISLAIWLFARKLPLREDAVARGGAALSIVLALAILGSWLGNVLYPELTGRYELITQYLLFSAILFACVSFVMWLFQTSLWTALFCCSAGYTVQNLASGASGLALLLLERLAGIGPTPSSMAVASLLATVLVYASCQLLLVRHLDEHGLSRIEDRSMLGMMLLVVFMVIGFDVINKVLQATSLPLPLLVALRLIHAATCALVLYVEYELLYNRQLQMEMALSSKLTSSHERQWRLSKANVDAINSKLHDMRHHIFRLLSKTDTDVDRELLQEISHELSVYDAHMHTANDALDIILSEKGLLCERNGIAFSCMADGTTLSHVKDAQLFQLFGDLMDEAIEESLRARGEERKAIVLDVRKRAGLAVVHLEHFLSAPGETSLAEKSERLSGARGLVELLGGTMDLRLADGALQVNLLLPASEA